MAFLEEVPPHAMCILTPALHDYDRQHPALNKPSDLPKAAVRR
jgi:hypothetical protein